MGAYLPRISLLDYFSASHYHYSIAQVFHHGDIVCDKKKSQIHFFAQILEKIYYLSLDGNIESAYRFVANYKVRLYRQGAGNSYALALASGEFVRIARHIIGFQSNGFQKLRHPVALFLASHLLEMYIQRL